MTVASSALLDGDVKQVQDVVKTVASDLIDELDSLAPEAVSHPTRPRVARLNSACESMVDRLLNAVHEQRPDVVVVLDGKLTLVEAKGNPSPEWSELIKHTLPQRALLSPWVSSLGFGSGVAIEVISLIRLSLPDTYPLAPPCARVTAGTGKSHVLLHLLGLVQAADQPALDFIAETLDLTTTELGRLFGVKRQAIDQWRERGIPSDRLDKVDTVRRTLELLRRYLRVDTLPAVARRPADRYGGLSMLEMIAADRHKELLDITADSFDFSVTA